MTVAELTELKKDVKRYVDNADEGILTAVLAMLHCYQEKDWWDEILIDERNAISIGLKQLENGEGIPNNEVKKMYPHWFAK